MDMKPFLPHYGTGKLLAVTDVSQTTTISDRNETVRVLNLGTTVAYVRVGDGAQTATAVTDMAIAPGQASTFGKPIGNNGLNPQQIAAVCAAAGTTNLHVMTGNGGL